MEKKVDVSLDRGAQHRKRLSRTTFSFDAFTVARLLSLNSAVPAPDNGVLSNFQTETQL